MTIIDAYWTPAVNMLKIKCKCGFEFLQRADRQNIRCTQCKATDNLHTLRARELAEQEDEVKFT